MWSTSHRGEAVQAYRSGAFKSRTGPGLDRHVESAVLIHDSGNRLIEKGGITYIVRPVLVTELLRGFRTAFTDA